jgi:hypothetical protein
VWSCSSYHVNSQYTGHSRIYFLFYERAKLKQISKSAVQHEITENSCTYWCVFFSSDFMHVIQDYWSFRSMLEFLGRVHLLQLVAWLPLHSIQLIHLLLAFKEQMQTMLLTSIFDMSDFFFNLVIWNCCKESHIFTCICFYLLLVVLMKWYEM